MFPLADVQHFVLAAQAGHVELIWSPWIIAETHRLLTYLWITRRLKKGGALDTAARRELSRVAHAWHRRLAPWFAVVDDRPPLEEMWTDAPPDEFDWPIWTAAVRGRANVVVTDNLRDGPPLDANGARQWQGIHYLTPADFRLVLDVWSDITETAPARPILSIAEYLDQRQPSAGSPPAPLPSHLETFIARMEERFRSGPPSSGS